MSVTIMICTTLSKQHGEIQKKERKQKTKNDVIQSKSVLVDSGYENN